MNPRSPSDHERNRGPRRERDPEGARHAARERDRGGYDRAARANDDRDDFGFAREPRDEPDFASDYTPGGYAGNAYSGYPGVGAYEGVGGYPGGGYVGGGGYGGGAGYQSGGGDYAGRRRYGDDEREPGREPPRGYGIFRERLGDDRSSIYGGIGTDQAPRGGHYGKGPKNYVRSDERIREDLSERLSDDDLIDASDVSIDVDGGIVRLHGRVAERWMKHRIEDLAVGCHGVKDVVNELRVGTSPAGGAAAGGEPR